MTRDDEIRKAAGQVAIRDNKGQYAHGFLMQALREAFTEGARWADRTMIERASLWLTHNAHEYLDKDNGYDTYKMIEESPLPNVEVLRVNYYDGVEWDFYALLGERESSDCGEQYEYIIIIKYVHELQHTLRLCGINKEIKL